VNLLRQGRRKALYYIGWHDRELAEELKKRYPSEVVKKRGRATRKEMREEERITRAFLDEFEIGDRFEKADGQAKKALNELCKLVKGEVGLASFDDMDARWGHKSKEKKFLGYKAHTAMDDSGIVTSAQVVSGETNEAGQLRDMLQDDKSKGITSECAVADGLYDNASTYTLGEEEGLPIYTPCRHGPQGRERDYFWFDGKGRYRCRNRCFAHQDLVDGNKKRYVFYAADCQNCLSRIQCLKKGEIQRHVWLNKCCELSQKQDKEKRQHALEKRKRIEPKFGEAKKWHCMRRARYRGRWRVAIQVFMTFFVLNAKRTVKLLQQTLAPPGSLGKCCHTTG
jgi:IS5 family transposase